MGDLQLIFRQILLHILSILNNERTVSSAYHLLKGKRSGQTIQDVGMYKLHQYFGILPKLDRAFFNEEIGKLVEEQFINVQEDGFYSISNSFEVEPPSLYLNGWKYRGNEHIFFGRLSLVVETMSHVKHHIKYFAPVEKRHDVLLFVRQFLATYPFQQVSFRKALSSELEQVLSGESFQEMQRELLVNRLTGVDVAGMTWGQLAQRYELAQMDIYLYYISGLHLMLREISERDVPILKSIAKNTEVTIPLTDSTKVTAQYLEKGYSIEQIANMRRLKTSTIEDHIVEMAMNIPSFSITPFMQQEDLNAILDASTTYATKKLRVLKEVLPQYSYFQLRLALAKGGA